VRTTFAIPTAFLLLVLSGCRTAPPPSVTTVPPEPAPVVTAVDPVLQRGIENYRAGRTAEAVTDLRSAADALLTPEQMRTYVSTGRFESLANFETAVVYLTMAYAKLGKDAEAREQIQRLLVAEQIHPTYAALALTADVAEFENVAKRIAPSAQLPANSTLAALRGTAPQPATVETRVAAERSAIDKEADRRIAEARQEADQRYAAERVAIQQELDRRIAEARAVSQKEADERIAADRAAIEKQMAEQIAAERAAAQPRSVLVEETGSAVDRLRQADALVTRGQIDAANAIYVRLLNAETTSRDVLAGVATGLYRTGDYSDAVRAFQRVGNLSRGEEDLRYYKAVSLYETGRYDDARKELACALPYIPLTEDVSRYRTKIEQAGQRASLH
jgi:tetratricopeptide (TPR) repeat protein